MKVSQLIVRTLREVPSGVEMPSHIFLLRGGYIKQMGAGLFSMLPLGKRVLDKIQRVLKEEMASVGGQEMDLPLINPAKLWRESGRYQAIGDELLRFKDRTGQNMVLAMTHEEGVTDLVRNVVVSYKQLPVMIYHIKEKFRDEPRARGGLIRVKEFLMKDAYSFHANAEDLDQYYSQVYDAYLRIFRRVGIEPVVVESDLGIMGGKQAHEFMLQAEHGEDNLILSEDGTYKANQEIALFDRRSVKEDLLELEKAATPNKEFIEEVADFLGVPAGKTMKAVMYTAGKKFILLVIRGDLEVSEIKVKNYLGVPLLTPATEEEILSRNLVPGFASPLGYQTNEESVLLCDHSIAEGNNFVGGANETGFHIKNMNRERDFPLGQVGDFALAKGGYKCAHSESTLKEVKGIEIGNIFKLGTKFSESMKAEFLDGAGVSHPFVMGCYGIGVGRLMASVVENSHDNFGPIWPREIAPYQIHLLSIGYDEAVNQACQALYEDLISRGFEVLYDDRDERPGVKFKDADLWGIPVRLGISAKTLAEKSAEFKIRGKKDFESVPLAELPARLESAWNELP